MKRYESKYNPAAKELSEYLNKNANKQNIRPEALNIITRVLDGVEVTDRIITEKEQVISQKDQILVQKDSVINQKTVELQGKDSSLIKKEREEFIEVLQRLDPSYTDHIGDWPNNIYKDAVVNGNPKLISDSLPTLKQSLLTKEFIIVLNKINPEIYKTDIVNLNSNQFSSAVSNWPDNIYKQAVIENNVEGIKLISESLPILKGRYLLRNEFIEILHKLNPESYPQNFEDWSTSRGKELIDNEDYATISSIIPFYRQELNKKLAVEKENELEKLKEALAFKETEIQNKDQLLFAKELEKQEILAQKEVELADKSFVKNQVIDEGEKLLAEQDIRLQNLLDLNAKLDAKMQYSAKEIKIREAEKEILSKIVNQKNDQLKYLLIEKENAVDNKSFEKNQVIKQLREEIIDLNKQLLEHDQHITHSVFLDEVGCQPGSSLFEKQLLESLNLSSINLSPINHGEQNQIVGNILGNFDIDNQHITHSIYPSGESSESFVIVDTENIH